MALLSKGRNAGAAAMKPSHRRRSCRGRARPSSGQAVSGRSRVHVDVCVLQLSSDFCCLSQGSKLEEKSSELWKMLNVDRGIKFTRTKRKGPTLRKTVKRGIGSLLCGSLVVVTVAPFKAQGDAAAAGQQAPALRPCPSQPCPPGSGGRAGRWSSPARRGRNRVSATRVPQALCPCASAGGLLSSPPGQGRGSARPPPPARAPGAKARAGLGRNSGRWSRRPAASRSGTSMTRDTTDRSLRRRETAGCLRGPRRLGGGRAGYTIREDSGAGFLPGGSGEGW